MDTKKTIIIGEIGINFAYGDSTYSFLDNVKQLIDVAVVAGLDYVKFQKRTPEECVPASQRNIEKIVPWRTTPTTYLQYKKDIELTVVDYTAIDEYCQSVGMKWFASVWDKTSVEVMSKFSTTLPNGRSGTIMKIPSACITDLSLIEHAKEWSEFLIISTGMSTQKEIDAAIRVGEPDVVMHTNSTYPSPTEELNLNYIKYLNDINLSGDFQKRFEVGYSGHEFGLTTTVAASVLGAKYIERHITLNRSLWGSDQLSSVEPQGILKLIKSIRDIESAMGEYGAREVLPSEQEKRKSLRAK